MNVEIGAEAAQFPEKEFISGFFIAVWSPAGPLNNYINIRGQFEYFARPNGTIGRRWGPMDSLGHFWGPADPCTLAVMVHGWLQMYPGVTK